MTIEKLSQSKLKVYISAADMKKWKLQPEMLTYNSPEAQALFNDVISKARAEHNFVCDGGNVVIEATPDNNSGIKVMLTVVNDNEEVPADDPVNPVPKQKRIVLKLTNIEDVVSACNHLLSVYHGQSHLFKYEGCYYIVLQTSEIKYSSVYDMGEIVDDPDLFYGYLNEFGDAVVRNDFLVNKKPA